MKDFIIDENDIPGAKLPKPIEECTCAVLRRWLLCRGAKTSGKLADLRVRVKHYVDHKLDAKYLRDPDGGINVLKKKAAAGLLDQTSPTDVSSFPTEGYSTNLSKIPKVTFGTWWKFMIDSMEFKKQLSTAKPLVKGYNFFMSNHVLSSYHLCKDSKHYIKSKVLPSMKKKMVYSCFIKLSSLGFVLSAKCGCPAGVDGRCNHVCATLFYLESVFKTNSKLSADEVSCTSLPCKWTIPSKRKGEVQPISAMKFTKHDYNKRNKRTLFTKEEKECQSESAEKECNSSNNESSTGKVLNDEKLKGLFSKLKDLEKEVGKSIGWCHILPQDVPVESESENELISPIKIEESPISMNGIQERVKKIKSKLFVNPKQVTEIEEETKEQSSSKSWHFHRQYRITASKCYRAAVLKSTTSPSKAVNDILYAKVFATKQMKKGLEMESEIQEMYIKEQHKCGHDNLVVEKSGLIVGKHDDGLVCDPSNTDNPQGILEMKYVETDESESLSEALLRKHMCVRSENSDITINQKPQILLPSTARDVLIRKKVG
ncbi:uncharacterized protein LOC114970731 [Acropora millepora]|uniref:uncharacterized protein LOC114970731 n=1 Tax=Acropora millepora TaxID=45264 RepID=UPI001CF19498|nr:uncharacterized protein LOC114970731 [Acropora millepora]